MIYHSAIFYPDDHDALLGLVRPIGNEPPHKAFILPHMEISSIAALYRKVFASIPDGARIVAIMQLHREPLAKDEGTICWSPGERMEETALGSIRIGSVTAGDGSPYEEEEYAMELLYPFVAFHNPSSLLCPIYAHLESAADSRKLTEILRPLDDGNTVFIVSSNMTGRIDPDRLPAERDRMIELLESGSHLIDPWRKGHITACGAPVIESVSRLGSGRWSLMGISEKETGAGHAALSMD